MALETDYLIIGAGASGLAFADEMLTRSNATMTIVDKRHAPGGHWNDAYSFVKLHQPSAFYGVESKELSDGCIDADGVNEGFLSLAAGPTITEYFHTVMRERLLPSGRVKYFPMSEVTEDGALRSLLSGKTEDVIVGKKIVDAGYQTNSVPRTHVRKFETADGVECVPPNDLPRIAPRFKNFCVLGAGKTAIDTVIWLLAAGCDPDAVTWVRPRDPWLWNRACTQPTMEFFVPVFQGFAARQKAAAEATSPEDFALRLEAAGVWLRIDPSIEPTLFHAATVSEREITELQRIKSVIRMGHVHRIEPGKVILAEGAAEMAPDTLFIDCTASAVERKPLKPVFDGGRITIQMVRFPQIAYSASMIAYLETTIDSDEEKNLMAAPIPLPDTVADYLKTLHADMMNQYHVSRNPDVRAWMTQSRLDGFSHLVAAVDKDDPEKRTIMQELKAASFAAAQNLPKLIAAAAAE